MGICAHSARDLCALSTEVGRNENQAALVLKSGCSGISVVAGLVPATSPWKDLLPIPARQSLSSTPARVPHADNADLADDSLCEISEISVSKKM